MLLRNCSRALEQIVTVKMQNEAVLLAGIIIMKPEQCSQSLCNPNITICQQIHKIVDDLQARHF
jgi:hypothetical protein